MRKALKPFVVVLLILSIVSLILGISLFSKREILKERTRLHEEGVAAIAEKLRFDRLDKAALKDLKQLKPQLDLVAVAANNVYDELQMTKQDLAATKEKLAQTEQELADTRAELEAAQNQIVALNATIEEKDAEIARAENRIQQLEQDTQNLQSQIDALNTQLAQKEDEILDLRTEIKTLEGIIDKLDQSRGMARLTGLTGRVMAVNPDWNFVVLDIGQEQGLVPNTELHVHRADQLVGKVRVSSVEEQAAIADILKDWELSPVKEGDHVIIF